MKHLLPALIFLLPFHIADAQLLKQWDFSYGGYDTDFINQLIATNDGGFIAGGVSFSDSGYDKTEDNFNPGSYTYDIWMIKCDANGTKLWDKNLGGTDNDFYYRAIKTSDEGVLIMGSTKSPMSGNITHPPKGTFDMYLVKLSSTGSIQWDARFGGSGGNSASDAVQLSDGGYLILGTTNSPQGLDVSDPSYGSDDYWLVRIDSLGNKLWDKRYGGSESDGGARILWHPGGGYLLVGTSVSDNSGVKTQNNYVTGMLDLWCVRIDTSGGILWNKILGSLEDDYGISAELTPDQNFIFSCINYANIGADKTENTYAVDDFWVIKTDTGLTRIWDHSVGGDSNEDEGGKISLNADGSYLVSGTSYSNPGFWKTVSNNGPENTWVVKIDAGGNKVWDKTVLTGYSHTETGLGVQLADGCYVIANDGDGFTGGDKTETSMSFDYWCVKYCDATAAPVAAFLSPDSICPGTCIDLINMTQNGSAYQWMFTGASVTTSTDINPVGICYATPGNYTITLAATGTTGSDTLTENITVYPFPPPQGILQNGDTLFANAGAVSYQWLYNGSVINGATNYFYVATQSGNYNVIATDENSCEVEAAIFNVIAGTSTLMSEKNGISIFPDPVSDHFTIQNANHFNSTGFEIHNAWGALVVPLKNIPMNPATSVDVSAFPTGVYWLDVYVGEKVYHSRFIKQ